MGFFSRLLGCDDAGREPEPEPPTADIIEIPRANEPKFMGKVGDVQYVEFTARLLANQYFDVVDDARNGIYHSAKFLLRGMKGQSVMMTLPKLRIISHEYESVNLINQSRATFTAAVLEAAVMQAVMPEPKPEQTDKTVTEQKDEHHAEPKLTD